MLELFRKGARLYHILKTLSPCTIRVCHWNVKKIKQDAAGILETVIARSQLSCNEGHISAFSLDAGGSVMIS